jgi:hypothetical protein
MSIDSLAELIDLMQNYAMACQQTNRVKKWTAPVQSSKYINLELNNRKIFDHENQVQNNKVPTN